ncbi:MAG: hypothetical protein CMJ81_08465 [Planctomycetaceae bacterium]|jgi:hypothetical protein|nr:hypothetical protein [Planctomycetaceae bacterium]
MGDHGSFIWCAEILGRENKACSDGGADAPHDDRYPALDSLGLAEVKSAFCKPCSSHDEKEKAANEDRAHVIRGEEHLVRSRTVLPWNRSVCCAGTGLLSV